MKALVCMKKALVRQFEPSVSHFKWIILLFESLASQIKALYCFLDDLNSYGDDKKGLPDALPGLLNDYLISLKASVSEMKPVY